MADELYFFASSSLSILSSTSYVTVEPDEGQAEIERDKRAGCGAQGTRLVKRKLVSVPIPLRIHCLGSSASVAMTRYDTLITTLERAVAYQVGDTESTNYINTPTYLIRRVDDQDPPTVYTVLDYDSRRVRKDLDGLTGHPTITVDLDLSCYPGQVLSS